MNSVKDFRGKIKPPVEKGVLKIERYAQRLTQGYSAYGGSYLWAPDNSCSLGRMLFLDRPERHRDEQKVVSIATEHLFANE